MCCSDKHLSDIKYHIILDHRFSSFMNLIHSTLPTYYSLSVLKNKKFTVLQNSSINHVAQALAFSISLQNYLDRKKFSTSNYIVVKPIQLKVLIRYFFRYTSLFKKKLPLHLLKKSASATLFSAAFRKLKQCTDSSCFV